MLKNVKTLWLPILFLLLVTLACNFTLTGPKPPSSPIPVTTEAVGSLMKTLESAQTQAQLSGDINVSFNEAQLTSVVALELQNQGQTSIQNPQIFLRDGQVQVFGTVDYQGISSTARVILKPALDPDGQPVFTVNSAKLGPFPIPSDYVQDIQTEINRVFTAQLAEIAPNTRFEQIIIANGILTISGHTR